MFNSKLKKEWLNKLEDAKDDYKKEMSEAQDSIMSLFKVRSKAVSVIKDIESFINTIANTPKKYDVKISKIDLALKDFNDVISLKGEAELATKLGTGIAGGGALAGAGVAALGPSAAMAIATTFGTASTGTAISALSGAAATNAALAWLGGGALVAGGGGMSAGSAFLALAGPVGWAIGGVALVGGALFAGSKNKKIAEKAEAEVYKIRKEIKSIVSVRAEVVATEKLTDEHLKALSDQLREVKKLVSKVVPKKGFIHRIINLFRKNEKQKASDEKSYSDFSNSLKKELGSLVNNTLSLAQLVEKKMG